MPAQRRAVAYVVIFAAILAIALLAFHMAPGPSVPSAPAGTLQKALADYQLQAEGKTVPSGAPIISSSPSHQVQVQNSGSQVQWWTTTGKEYQSVTDGTDPGTLFERYGFTNYSYRRQVAPP